MKTTKTKKAIAELNPLPLPKKYPVTLDKCLRLWFPQLQGRTADRAALIKRAIRENEMLTRWNLSSDKSKPPKDFTPSADEVNEMFASIRTSDIKDWLTFSQMRGTFLEYFNWWKSQTRRDAAKKSWQPTSLKKRAATRAKKKTKRKKV